MSIIARSICAVALFAAPIAGCVVGTEGEDNALLGDAPALEAQAACTASATCGSCTTLSCSGASSCSAVDGATGYVICDGVKKSCQRCEFNGNWYNDGQVIGGGPAAGVYCSSKFDGYCIGGVFAGDPCVASGECYARCCNGTWK